MTALRHAHLPVLLNRKQDEESILADLPIRLRTKDGRTVEAQLPAARHRALHLAFLHGANAGWVEVAAGRRGPEGLRLITRRRADHFVPAGLSGGPGWLDAPLARAHRHDAAGLEVFIGALTRRTPGPGGEHVTRASWLWVDVDEPDAHPALAALLDERPAHLLVRSGGTGGLHAYWRLSRPLPAKDGAIERANARLAYASGGDLACRDRGRLLRLAGTVNGKTGRRAQLLWVDLATPTYPVKELVGDLPDPPGATPRARRTARSVVHDDPYKRIAPAEYFLALAGIEVPAHGLVSCPSPRHKDDHPSCSVGRDASEGWYCHAGCGGGAIYDLASLIEGGPTGPALRGGDFRRARERVRAALGER